MIAELSAAMSALKETAGIVKLFADAKTEAEIKSATIELQSKLLTLQSECFSLGDAIRSRDEEVIALKAKIAEFEDFKSQTIGYELNKFESGAIVYSKKQIVNGSECLMHLCPKCYLKREISFLQPTGQPGYNSHSDKYFHQYICHSCTSIFSLDTSTYTAASWIS